MTYILLSFNGLRDIPPPASEENLALILYDQAMHLCTIGKCEIAKGLLPKELEGNLNAGLLKKYKKDMKQAE